MDLSKAIKIHSSAFKQIGMTDLFFHSFVGDVDLFPAESTEGRTQKTLDQMSENLTCCSPFALTVGDMAPRRGEFNGKYMEFQPGPTGHPTLRDLDIMLYVQSWLVNARQECRKNDRSDTLTFDVEDFYEFSGRARRDDRDEAFVQALERLRSSTYTTNTRPDWADTRGATVKPIKEYELERDEKGRITTATVRLSGFIIYMIDDELFSWIHKDFVMQSPMRKTICLVLMHYCIHEEEGHLTITFEKLHEITGSKRPPRKISELIDDIIENPLPGFVAEVDEEDETITFWCDFEITPDCPLE